MKFVRKDNYHYDICIESVIIGTLNLLSIADEETNEVMQSYVVMLGLNPQQMFFNTFIEALNYITSELRLEFDA